MILVTVGTQLPFDRLVNAMDDLAPRLGEPVFAQIGPTALVPRHLEWAATLTPAEFDARAAAARVLVSHAGTGSILAAQRHQLPVIIVPRRASLGEHRNEHQLATAAGLAHKRGVYVAHTADEIEVLLGRTDLVSAETTGETASRQTLIGNLRAFLNA